MYSFLTTFRPRLLLYTSYLFFDYHQCCFNSTPTIYGCSVLVKSVQRECISSSDFYLAVTSSTQSPHVHQFEYVTQQSPRKTSTFVSMLCMGMQLTLSYWESELHAKHLGHHVHQCTTLANAIEPSSTPQCNLCLDLTLCIVSPENSNSRDGTFASSMLSLCPPEYLWSSIPGFGKRLYAFTDSRS